MIALAVDRERRIIVLAPRLPSRPPGLQSTTQRLSYRNACSHRSIKKDGDGGQVRGIQRCAKGYRFRLKAANGRVVAAGEGYKTKAAVENGIKSVQTNAPGATVVDQTG